MAQTQLRALQEKYVAALEEARAVQARMADDKATHAAAIDAVVDETHKTVPALQSIALRHF